MAIVEISNEQTGEVLQFDNEKNYLDPEIWGRDVEITDEEYKALRRETRWLLQQYGYNTEHIDTVLEEWRKNKGWLINMLREHPDYKEGKFYISFDSEVERKLSKSGVKKFVEWAVANIANTQIIEDCKADITKDRFQELSKKYKDLEAIESRTRNLKLSLENDFINYFVNDTVDISINGNPLSYYARLADEAREARDKYTLYNGGQVYYSKVNLISGTLIQMYDLLFGIDGQFVTEDFADSFNLLAGKLELKTTAKKGQKYSKLYSKLGIEIGYSKYVSMQQTTFTDPNTGEVRSKNKDMGYNYWFYAVFADSINPKKFPRTTVISVNPIDYLTMSFGNSWASCQTIDVDQLRVLQGGMESNYHGMYSAGTMSYMLDPSTVIFYYVDSKMESENGNLDLELKDKFKRCLFYIGENKLIQSRVYPDGRDGRVDEDDALPVMIAKDIRETMEEIISKCAKVPNSWVYKAGKETASSFIITKGSHYADYQNYNDVGTAFLKIGDRLVKNANKIQVGHVTICPSCGNVHEKHENIQCPGCITRDHNTQRQVNFLKAFKYNDRLFSSKDERDKFVLNNYGEETVEQCHVQDELDAEARHEESTPSSPFYNSESNSENADSNQVA